MKWNPKKGNAAFPQKFLEAYDVKETAVITPDSYLKWLTWKTLIQKIIPKIWIIFQKIIPIFRNRNLGTCPERFWIVTKTFAIPKRPQLTGKAPPTVKLLYSCKETLRFKVYMQTLNHCVLIGCDFSTTVAMPLYVIVEVRKHGGEHNKRSNIQLSK